AGRREECAAAQRAPSSITEAGNASALLTDLNEIERGTARSRVAAPARAVRAEPDVEQGLVRYRRRPRCLLNPLRAVRVDAGFRGHDVRAAGAGTNARLDPAVRVLAARPRLLGARPRRTVARALFVPEEIQLVALRYLIRQPHARGAIGLIGARLQGRVRHVRPFRRVTGIGIGVQSGHRLLLPEITDNPVEPQTIFLDRPAERRVVIVQLEQLSW